MLAATQHHTGKSVTELEIRWGVLLKEQMKDHALFFFRDPAFMDDIPEAKRAEMAAENDSAAEKLARLKEEIVHAGLPIPVVENYACQYAGLRINWRLARSELNEKDAQALEEVAEDGLVDNDEYATLNNHLRDIVHRYGHVQLERLEELGGQVLDRLWDAVAHGTGAGSVAGDGRGG